MDGIFLTELIEKTSGFFFQVEASAADSFSIVVVVFAKQVHQTFFEFG